MAGDWIKMRGNLWDDPRVTGICDLTDQSEATIVGALYWLWATADQHSEDGVMPGLSLRQIDRKTGVPGLGKALVSIGWLVELEGGVQIARFNEHNGDSAKKRAQTAKRVASHRTGNADVTRQALQDEHKSDTGALARGREREEKSNTSNNQQACVRAENDQLPMTPDWRPGETFSSISKPAGLIPPTGADWDAALAEFVSYWLSKPGKQRTQSEWEHALVKSLKHSKGTARGGRSPPGQQPSRKETQLFTAALMTGTAGTQGQQPTTTEIIDADPSPSAPRLVG